MTYQNELSNLSYTNKDFSQIYPELLDLAQKISYKWDPAYSDESDPGVVLLKLAALMADKCNYNIDKNTLEQFPLSVSQIANARQLFDQCGYTMRYYQSAKTTLKLRVTKEPDITLEDFATLGVTDDTLELADILEDSDYTRQYTIPRFTMFCDNDSSTVFTSINETTVSSDGQDSFVDAVEGVINTLEVNGSDRITQNMLDLNNRIYFPVLNIPENGIFISNYESENLWEPVDNLYIQPLKSKIYKFGLSLDGKRCYVEFPSDISSIIGEGICIKYVTTSGYLGNVRAGFIKKFFTEIKTSRFISGNIQEQDVNITSDNIYINNDSAATEGKDPESIDDAYRNYQKVKNTFSTLVTTKDYTDYLRTSETLSNCIVCDRSSDLQSSYKVMQTVQNTSQLVPIVRTVDTKVKALVDSELKDVFIKTDEMTAFDLRVYGLSYVSEFKNEDNFSKSFLVEHRNINGSIEGAVEDVSCLSHNILPLKKNNIIILKNKFPIKARIISSSTLTTVQKDDIISNIEYALFQLLNSKQLEFGEEIDYTSVYNTILKSDTRINAIALEEFKYETYAMYIDDNDELKAIRIDANSNAPERDTKSCTNDTPCETCSYCLWKKFRNEIYARCVLSGNTPLFPSVDVFVRSLSHEATKEGKLEFPVTRVKGESTIRLKKEGNSSVVYVSDKLNNNDVITLTSPNLVTDRTYTTYTKYITNIGYSEDEERLDFGQSKDGVVVPKDSDYVLKNHEYIIFFTNEGDENNPRYTYTKYVGVNDDGTPTIISPNFNMYKQSNPESRYQYIASVKLKDLGFMALDNGTKLEFPDTKGCTSFFEFVPIDEETRKKNYVKESDIETAVDNCENQTINEVLYEIAIGNEFDVKNNIIETKKVNRIELSNPENGTTNFYWILKHTELSSAGEKVYRLFDTSTNVYVLKEGEQLIYSDPKKRQFYILGTGTRIERENSNTNWDCPVLDDPSEFVLVGPRYFDDDYDDAKHPWFNIKKANKSSKLYATEMLFKKLGSGTKLRILPENDVTDVDGLNITRLGIFDDASHSFDTTYSSFRIIDQDGNTENIPDRKHSTIRWNVQSSFNLNASIQEPQQLYSSQKLSVNVGDKEIEFQGSDEGDNRIFIQPELPLRIADAYNVDISKFDIETETFIPHNLYIYALKSSQLTLPDHSYENLSSYWNSNNHDLSVNSNHVLIPNITLDKGNYIIPISMEGLNSHPKVYLNRVRNLEDGILTDSEKEKIVEFFGNTLDFDKLWKSNRAPTKLLDFVSWIYSYCGVKVSSLNNISFDGLIEDNEYQGNELLDSDIEDYDTFLNNVSTLSVGDVVAFNGPSADGDPHVDQFYVIVSPYNNKDRSIELVGLQFLYDDKDMAKITTRQIDNIEDLEKYPESNYGAFRVIRPSNISDNTVETSFNESELPNIFDTTSMIDGTYYYRVEIDKTMCFTFVIDARDSSNVVPHHFVFHELRKFEYPKLTELHKDSISIENYNEIISLIHELDVNNSFDYLYDVPDIALVEYPLDSVSFLNSYHPFNKFTICEYVPLSPGYKSKNLKILDKSR